MPWCEDCSKFWNKDAMAADGTCPTCGKALGSAKNDKVPWYFKVMLAGFGVYMVYRIWWLYEWLPKHI